MNENVRMKEERAAVKEQQKSVFVRVWGCHLRDGWTGNPCVRIGLEQMMAVSPYHKSNQGMAACYTYGRTLLYSVAAAKPTRMAEIIRKARECSVSPYSIVVHISYLSSHKTPSLRIQLEAARSTTT
eukprot:COSAG05_NODE_5022_length_1287_cov_1.328283_1_plen_127_part_00